MKAFFNNVINTMTNATKSAGKKQAWHLAKHCEKQQSSKHVFDSVLSSAQQHVEKQTASKNRKPDQDSSKCNKNDNLNQESMNPETSQTTDNESASQTEETGTSSKLSRKHGHQKHHRHLAVENECAEKPSKETFGESSPSNVCEQTPIEMSDTALADGLQANRSESNQDFVSLNNCLDFVVSIIPTNDIPVMDDSQLLAILPMSASAVPGDINDVPDDIATDTSVPTLDNSLPPNVSTEPNRLAFINNANTEPSQNTLPQENSSVLPETIFDSGNVPVQTDINLDSQQWQVLQTPEALSGSLTIDSSALSSQTLTSQVQALAESNNGLENTVVSSLHSQGSVTDSLSVDMSLNSPEVPENEAMSEKNPAIQTNVFQIGNNLNENVGTETDNSPKSSLAPVPLIAIQPSSSNEIDQAELDLFHEAIPITVQSASAPSTQASESVVAMQVMNTQDIDGSDTNSPDKNTSVSDSLSVEQGVANQSENITTQPQAKQGSNANNGEPHQNPQQSEPSATIAPSKSHGVLFPDASETNAVALKHTQEIQDDIDVDSVSSTQTNDTPLSTMASQAASTNPTLSTAKDSNVTATKMDTLFQFPGVDTSDQISQGIQEGLRINRPQIVMRLSPEELGDVNIRLSTNALQQVTARLFVSNSDTQQYLQENMHQLKQTLESKGIQVEHLTVTVAHHTDNSGQFNQSQSQEQSGSQSSFTQQQSFQHQHQHAQHLYQQFNQNPTSRFATAPWRQQGSGEGISVATEIANAKTDPYNPNGSISVFA